MKLLSQLKLGSRLGLGFGLVLVLLGLVTGIGLFALRSINEDLQYLNENSVPSLQVAASLKSTALNLRRYEYNHLVAKSDAQMNEAEAMIAGYQAELKKALADYEPLITDENDRALWKESREYAERYAAAWPAIQELSRKNSEEAVTQAEKLMTGESRLEFAKLVDTLDKLWKFNVDYAKGLAGNSQDNYRSTLWQLSATAGVALLIGLASAFLITRSVVAPVRRSLEMAEAVAAGDLTQRAKVEGRDETSMLLKALDHMSDRLSDLVSQVRQGAEGVATASAQIAQGNQDLSARTEQQASALEETSASMEQMGSTASQNADNARAASQLAQSASSVAEQGGAVVGQVVTTMRDIQHSSQKINDIIGTIDGIAFQTNILALNAAVEAARAGEQGRGFAVVAGEVRTLAQRSAEAAKEIKQLINASVERVEQGTALVDQAGNTMQEVVQSIQRVTDIVGEISSASQEQNAGVSQVSEAVSNMDQTTQQNAALVEESASAAASLRQQADQLVQAVSVFRTSGSAAMVSPVSRVVASAPVSTPRSLAASRPAVRAAAKAAPAALPPVKVAAAAKPAPRSAPAAGASDDWESF